MNITNDVNTNPYNHELFKQGQIRLAELSVFNWGSFQKLQTVAINPEGTLITGDNGAGKSTLIDGLMALLLPAGKATFNMAAAQGDRSDRSLMSYMRGNYGTAHDGANTRVKSKRDKAVVTGLRALYRGDDGSYIVLAALFWTTQTSNALSDVKRLYIVAKRNLQLKEMLDAFAEGNVRQLKQWLRDDPTITCCDESFTDYQELYRKLLHMDNKNAPALLSRALGLKKIDDLTKLIRELVLEPSTVKNDAKQVVDEFADLVAIHNKLLDAKEQEAHLQRLPDCAKTLTQSTTDLDLLMLERRDLGVYFGERFALLWSDQIKLIGEKVTALSIEISDTEQQKADASVTVEQRYKEYLNLGGDKIESIKKEIEHTKSKLNDVLQASSAYQSVCKKLDLKEQLEQQQFNSNQQLAQEKQNNIEQDIKQCQDHFGEVAAVRSSTEEKLKSITNDIKQIEARPDSNIGIKYQNLRDELISSLQLSANELVFIGELIDVGDEHKQWQGAIERALGGLRSTLLVPQKKYSMVTRWLNVKHTGLHVRVQVVQKEEQQNSFHRLKTPASFKENGFLKKLVWKQHDYREWLKKHLSKFDLHCVTGTDELDATPFSMTQQGLVHMEQGRFEKKDQNRIDDRRNWSLGFSNKSRLMILNVDKQETQQQLQQINVNLDSARKELDETSARAALWERLQTYQWDAINTPYWQQRLEVFTTNLKQFEKNNNSIEQAKDHWQQSKAAYEALETRLTQWLLQKGALDKDLENAQSELDKSQQIAEPGIADDIRNLLQKRVGVVSLHDSTKQPGIERKLDNDIEKIRHRKSNAENSAIGIMASFRTKEQWQPYTADWLTGLGGLDDYLEHYANLVEEGLPKLVDQFKERLNKHATQSLAKIRTKLDSERDDILERIDTINKVLIKTEFKQGSHLKLGAKNERYQHVQEFERKLRKALSQATSDDHEARFKLLSEVVDILDKACATGTANTMESLRLLDSRYQMSFFAEEIDSETKAVRDVLESSSGKSGGEKESFAGTIVAASLAYVLTPDGHDKPIYSTVFLDEAFSNTAEAVSRRVLRVFKALHIHVNLITPYKNLNLARESAKSLLIVERNSDLHESTFCEVTWQEMDQRMVEKAMKRKQAILNSQAEALGITVDANH